PQLDMQGLAQLRGHRVQLLGPVERELADLRRRLIHQQGRGHGLHPMSWPKGVSVALEGSGPILEQTMWPETPAELIRIQRELASAHPDLWHPQAARPRVAWCFVCFARPTSGRGRAGQRGWAAATLMEANRHLEGTATVRGEAAAAYQPGLLALREGRLL